MTAKNKILATRKDSKGRPLVILMRMKNGSLMHVFKRYKDMSKEDRLVATETYRRVSAAGGGEVSEASENEMARFLDFKEDRPCG